ncbi:hypothetical protein K466DRAFT_485711 [Polyporus arcularius HHB13444]|uniref:Uncharacterized protein n=1 Tax=Polyporus arcularius HHB13444 TaxID=1314778 RepID=A0A5C3PLI7_9APHY|nr:hypothetical protein K466DRAFT_485711 [Polyporus arcularius HHB13444]
MQFTNAGNPNDLLTPLPLDFKQHSRDRQSSISSTCTSSSRASSPTNAWPARRMSVCTRPIRRHHPYLPSEKYRVVLSNSYDDADAMLVLPYSPDAVDENNQLIPEKAEKSMTGKAYLVVGPLAVQLRKPQNRARFRAAVHPYRFIPRNPTPSHIATPTLPDALRQASTSSEESETEMSA